MNIDTITLRQFQCLFGWHDTPATSSRYAWKEDRPALNTLNRFVRPRRVLELGINEGITAELLLRVSPWIEQYVGVDVPSTWHTTMARQQAEVPCVGCVAWLVKDNRLRVVIASGGTAQGLAAITGRDFDFVFIDADHSFEGVQRDTMLAESVLSDRAVIVWHDYNEAFPGVVECLKQHNGPAGRIVHILDTRLAFRFYDGRGATGRWCMDDRGVGLTTEPGQGRG
jgi:predicted O-methyltransferase YrrM